jgi:hypothetical protein
MADRFPTRAGSVSAPAKHAFAVTPSDSTDLAQETRALYVGSSGNLAVIMASGETVTFAGVAAGSLLPIRVDRVKATGTTASDILGVY